MIGHRVCCVCVECNTRHRYAVSHNHEGYFVSERVNKWRSRFGVVTWAGSNYYKTRAEAEALRVWLLDRYTRYPFNPLLAEAP